MSDTTQEYNLHGGQQQINPAATQAVQNFYGDEFARKLLQRSEHPITVAVAGPAVDTPLGLPAPENLIPRIADFLSTDAGRAIDAALRKAIGSVRFHFDKFIERAIDNLAKHLDRELRTICSNVKAELDHNPSLTAEQHKLGQLVVRLFHKIIEVKENASIDSETEQLITEVLGTTVTDESIIDFSHLNYTETFKTIIVQILQRSIHEHENPILRHVYRNILDIGQLLSQYFYGFYEGRDSYIRDYMYISWMLWSYLVSEEQRIVAAHDADPAQLHIPETYARLQALPNLQLVTLAHTTFAQQAAPDALYFYGSLTNYVDVENKNDIPLPSIHTLNIEEFVRTRLAEEICFSATSGDRRSLPIPSFLPPLKLKPVISQRYIDVWYRTGEMLRHAERILLLGCTLDTLDLYFADMLRQSEAKQIVITTPDLATATRHLATLFQLAPSAYTPCEHAGHKARKFANRILLVEGEPNDIPLDEL